MEFSLLFGCGYEIMTLRLEATNTNVVAKPKLIALATLLVTARSGHKPNKATNAWLLFQRPFLLIFKYSCIRLLLYQQAGFAIHWNWEVNLVLIIELRLMYFINLHTFYGMIKLFQA